MIMMWDGLGRPPIGQYYLIECLDERRRRWAWARRAMRGWWHGKVRPPKDRYVCFSTRFRHRDPYITFYPTLIKPEKIIPWGQMPIITVSEDEVRKMYPDPEKGDE